MLMPLLLGWCLVWLLLLLLLLLGWCLVQLLLRLPCRGRCLLTLLGFCLQLHLQERCWP